MERTFVAARKLVSVGYDIHSKILELEFWDGSIERYSNVPSSFHFALMNALWKDQYIDTHLRRAGFHCETVPAELCPA